MSTQCSSPCRSYLAYNNLTGDVPASWLQLPSLKLVQVQPGNAELCTGSVPPSAQFDLCPSGYVVCSADSLVPDGPQCSSSSSSGGSSFPVAAVAVPVAVVGAAALVAAAIFVVRRRRRAAVASATAASKADAIRFATAQELQQVRAQLLGLPCTSQLWGLRHAPAGVGWWPGNCGCFQWPAAASQGGISHPWACPPTCCSLPGMPSLNAGSGAGHQFRWGGARQVQPLPSQLSPAGVQLPALLDG